MSELHIRIEDMSSFFQRARADARRLDSGHAPQEPHVLSFESMETLAALLSATRWALLAKLREAGPTSIRALAKALSRDYRGVHADVIRLIETGLIERDADQMISVPWSKITAEVSFDAAA